MTIPRILLAGVAACSLSTTSHAQIYVDVATESFDYTVGGLGGNSGGTGWFNDWWSGGAQDDALVTTPGHDSVGEKATTQWEHAGSYRIPETGPHPDIAPNLNFGSGDGVMWLTFTSRRASGSTDDYGGISLNEQFVGEKLFIGGLFATGEWGIADAVGGSSAAVAGSNIDTLTELVIKLTYGTGGDQVDLWLNPSSAHPTSMPDATLSVADYEWNEIRLQSGVNNGGTTGYEFDGLHFEKEASCLVTTYCTVADGSTNNTVNLTASGCELATPITLDLSNGPPNQFCYLLIGVSSGIVTDPPGALGDLCLGGGVIGRYAKDAGPISSGGTFSTDISNTVTGGAGYGIPGGGNIVTGDTYQLQYWHRRPSGQPSGFTEALSILFN